MIELELLHYGYLFVFVGAIVEGDATLLTASFLARRGYVDFLWVLIVAALGTIAANQTYFELARRKGPNWISNFPKAKPRIETITSWTTNYGGPLILASRFLFGFRTLVPVVCGASGMNRWRFTLWNLIGAVVWSVSVGTVGYLGAHALTLVLADIRSHERLVAAGIAVCTVVLIAWRTRGRDWIDIWKLSSAGPRLD